MIDYRKWGLFGVTWPLYIFTIYFSRGSGCDVLWWVCVSVGLSVCLSARISGTTSAIVTRFLCMLPVSVARSSSDTFMIGRIAYRREWVFFPIDNAYISGIIRAICTNFFMYVAYVHGSVFLRHVYNRSHRLSPGRDFLPQWKCIIGLERGWKCTARAKYAIYDCLVISQKRYKIREIVTIGNHTVMAYWMARTPMTFSDFESHI